MKTVPMLMLVVVVVVLLGGCGRGIPKTTNERFLAALVSATDQDKIKWSLVGAGLSEHEKDLLAQEAYDNGREDIYYHDLTYKAFIDATHLVIARFSRNSHELFGIVAFGDGAQICSTIFYSDKRDYVGIRQPSDLEVKFKNRLQDMMIDKEIIPGLLRIVLVLEAMTKQAETSKI